MILPQSTTPFNTAISMTKDGKMCVGEKAKPVCACTLTCKEEATGRQFVFWADTLVLKVLLNFVVSYTIKEAP
jgi:hypothetical protein